MPKGIRQASSLVRQLKAHLADRECLERNKTKLRHLYPEEWIVVYHAKIYRFGKNEMRARSFVGSGQGWPVLSYLHRPPRFKIIIR